MKAEKGRVKPWREKHKISFEEEREIIWEKTTRRENDLVRFVSKGIYPEFWDKYIEIKMEYLKVASGGGKWGERKGVLDKLADLIGGDDQKAFMMLDFYRMECSNFCAEKMIRKYGGSFGWTRYEWLMHWHKQFGVYEDSQLQRWVEKGRFGAII